MDNTSILDDNSNAVSPEAWKTSVPLLNQLKHFSTAEHLFDPSQHFWNYHTEEPVKDGKTGSQLVGSAHPNALVKKMQLFDDHFVLHMTDNTITKVPVTASGILGSAIYPGADLAIDIKTLGKVYDKASFWKSFLPPVTDLTIQGSVFPFILIEILTHAGGLRGIRRLNVFPVYHIALDRSTIFNILPKEMEHYNFDDSKFFGNGNNDVYVLPGPLKPLVTKLVVQQHKLTVTFDTMESIEFEPNTPSMESFFATAECHTSFELECKEPPSITNGFCNIPWNTFLRRMESVTMTNKLSAFALEGISRYVQPKRINCPVNGVFFDRGILKTIRPGDSNRLSADDVYIDTRGTHMSGMIDNITSLMFVFSHRPRSDTIRDNFRQITLLVNDFCRGSALGTQIKRLEYLLSSAHGQISTATVITSAFGDDSILDDLRHFLFVFTHRGYIRNSDGQYERYDYWCNKVSAQKQIILGFRCRNILPLNYADVPMVGQSRGE